MEISYYAHHVDISPRLQERAEQGLHKLARRLGRVVDASVRFEEEGPVRRVEIIVHLPRGRRFVAAARGRYFGPAVTTALARIGAQTDHLRRAAKTRARSLART
jgi:ribosome-associated translation inhibitor RaiA